MGRRRSGYRSGHSRADGRGGAHGLAARSAISLRCYRTAFHPRHTRNAAPKAFIHDGPSGAGMRSAYHAVGQKSRWWCHQLQGQAVSITARRPFRDGGATGDAFSSSPGQDPSVAPLLLFVQGSGRTGVAGERTVFPAVVASSWKRMPSAKASFGVNGCAAPDSKRSDRPSRPRNCPWPHRHICSRRFPNFSVQQTCDREGRTPYSLDSRRPGSDAFATRKTIELPVAIVFFTLGAAPR